jgi:hypothetical protein
VAPALASTLDRLIRTFDNDVGCAETADVLDVYAERTASDPARVARRYPGVAAHLRSCCPCRTDLEGLLTVIETEETE